MAEPMMQDQTSEEQPEDSGSESADGYVIEIRVEGGKIGVCVESLGEQAEEDQNGGESAESMDDEEYQQVGSIAEACKLVKEIYAHAGNMADMTASQNEMMSGYGKGA